jgi:hypothetical protein
VRAPGRCLSLTYRLPLLHRTHELYVVLLTNIRLASRFTLTNQGGSLVVSFTSQRLTISLEGDFTFNILRNRATSAKLLSLVAAMFAVLSALGLR